MPSPRELLKQLVTTASCSETAPKYPKQSGRRALLTLASLGGGGALLAACAAPVVESKPASPSEIETDDANAKAVEATEAPAATNAPTEAPAATNVPPTEAPTSTFVPTATETEAPKAQIVATIGWAENPELLASYPVMTPESPENPAHPLLRDKDGNPVLGVIAMDSSTDVYKGSRKSSDVAVAAVVGRIVRVNKISQGGLKGDWMDVVVDVPQENNVLRFSYTLNVKEDCTKQKSHSATYILPEIYEQIGQPLQNQPVEFDLNQLELYYVPTYCNTIKEFLKNCVGAQFGFFFMDKMISARNPDEVVDTSEIYNQLITGTISQDDSNIWLTSSGEFFPASAGIEYAK